MYLASPAVVAASALAGVIAAPVVRTAPCLLLQCFLCLFWFLFWTVEVMVARGNDGGLNFLFICVRTMQTHLWGVGGDVCWVGAGYGTRVRARICCSGDGSCPNGRCSACSFVLLGCVVICVYSCQCHNYHLFC